MPKDRQWTATLDNYLPKNFYLILICLLWSFISPLTFISWSLPVSTHDAIKKWGNVRILKFSLKFHQNGILLTKILNKCGSTLDFYMFVCWSVWLEKKNPTQNELKHFKRIHFSIFQQFTLGFKNQDRDFQILSPWHNGLFCFIPIAQIEQTNPARLYS